MHVCAIRLMLSSHSVGEIRQAPAIHLRWSAQQIVVHRSAIAFSEASRRTP